MKDIRVLLHDIRSSYNVGSMFRTADAAGVSRIYISGYTPAPLDRFKRPNKEIAKTALGAEKNLKWEKVLDVQEFLRQLKQEGFHVVAIEQSKKSIDYKQAVLPERSLIIVGNEVDGVPTELLEICDTVVEIPMNGSKESLNVAVAFGIALFRMMDK